MGEEKYLKNYSKPAELVRLMVFSSDDPKRLLKSNGVLDCFKIHNSGVYLKKMSNASRIDSGSSFVDISKMVNIVGLYTHAQVSLANR